MKQAIYVEKWTYYVYEYNDLHTVYSPFLGFQVDASVLAFLLLAWTRKYFCHPKGLV
jgi:hypothetical protein